MSVVPPNIIRGGGVVTRQQLLQERQIQAERERQQAIIRQKEAEIARLRAARSRKKRQQEIDPEQEKADRRAQKEQQAQEAFEAFREAEKEGEKQGADVTKITVKQRTAKKSVSQLESEGVDTSGLRKDARVTDETPVTVTTTKVSGVKGTVSDKALKQMQREADAQTTFALFKELDRKAGERGGDISGATFRRTGDTIRLGKITGDPGTAYADPNLNLKFGNQRIGDIISAEVAKGDKGIYAARPTLDKKDIDQFIADYRFSADAQAGKGEADDVIYTPKAFGIKSPFTFEGTDRYGFVRSLTIQPPKQTTIGKQDDRIGLTGDPAKDFSAPFENIAATFAAPFKDLFGGRQVQRTVYDREGNIVMQTDSLKPEVEASFFERVAFPIGERAFQNLVSGKTEPGTAKANQQAFSEFGSKLAKESPASVAASLAASAILFVPDKAAKVGLLAAKGIPRVIPFIAKPFKSSSAARSDLAYTAPERAFVDYGRMADLEKSYGAQFSKITKFEAAPTARSLPSLSSTAKKSSRPVSFGAVRRFESVPLLESDLADISNQIRKTAVRKAKFELTTTGADRVRIPISRFTIDPSAYKPFQPTGTSPLARTRDLSAANIEREAVLGRISPDLSEGFGIRSQTRAPQLQERFINPLSGKVEGLTEGSAPRLTQSRSPAADRINIENVISDLTGRRVIRKSDLGRERLYEARYGREEIPDLLGMAERESRKRRTLPGSLSEELRSLRGENTAKGMSEIADTLQADLSQSMGRIGKGADTPQLQEREINRLTGQVEGFTEGSAPRLTEIRPVDPRKTLRIAQERTFLSGGKTILKKENLADYRKFFSDILGRDVEVPKILGIASKAQKARDRALPVPDTKTVLGSIGAVRLPRIDPKLLARDIAPDLSERFLVKSTFRPVVGGRLSEIRKTSGGDKFTAANARRFFGSRKGKEGGAGNISRSGTVTLTKGQEQAESAIKELAGGSPGTPSRKGFLGAGIGVASLPGIGVAFGEVKPRKKKKKDDDELTIQDVTLKGLRGTFSKQPTAPKLVGGSITSLFTPVKAAPRSAPDVLRASDYRQALKEMSRLQFDTQAKTGLRTGTRSATQTASGRGFGFGNEIARAFGRSGTRRTGRGGRTGFPKPPPLAKGGGRRGKGRKLKGDYFLRTQAVPSVLVAALGEQSDIAKQFEKRFGKLY